MINHVWSVVCSRVVIDRDTNNISIQNVLERVTIRGVPQDGAVIPLSFTVVSFWIRADREIPARGQARARYVSPSGDTVMVSDELDVDLSNVNRHRTRFGFTGMPVPEAGYYSVCVEILQQGEEEWQTVAEVPIEVIFTPPNDQETEGHPTEN